MELRLLEHLRRAAEVEALPFARIERAVDDLESRLIERLILDLIAYLRECRMVDGRERVAGKILVDDAGHALEVLEAGAVRHLEDLVLDEACVRHEHRDDAPVVERQELQAAERSLRHLWREDQ